MDTVCHVLTKLELGGAQAVALFAASHLSPARFRSVLVIGPGGLLTEEARTQSGIDVVEVPFLRRELRPLADLRALLQLLRLFRRLHPCVVHTHSSKAGILGRWAAWLARVPIIVHTIHGYGITPAQSPWVRWVLVQIERLTGAITTHWIAVAQADIEQGIRWGLFRRRQVSLIRPGIDPVPFVNARTLSERNRVRESLGFGPDELVVGTVACLKQQKAPQDFVAVAARVCKVFDRARFVLIGDGEERPAVEAGIAAFGLQNRLLLLGWRRDIPSLLQALDAFALTSHWEGLPRVLLEARLAGLPVVATRVGGAEEAVIEGEQGWLFQAGDVEGMSSRLCAVLADEGLRSRLREQPAGLPQEFDIREMTMQYEQLYVRLMPGMPPPMDRAA